MIEIKDYEIAKKELLQLNFSKCEPYFKKNKNLLELGYCKLLRGKLKDAKKLFAAISNHNPRGHWALRLIQFIEGYVCFMPTYFEIRNFLEIDIHLLLKAKQIKFVENIINGDDLFAEVNTESYKFIARVLMFNKHYDIAKIYLDKGINYSYTDPELHILNAEYHLINNDKESAIKSLRNCLNVLPEYYPAKTKLKELGENV